MDFGQKQIKGYEIKERIGAGGFGAVYRAFQTTVGREVAVKVIIPSLSSKPDFIRRFEGEAQVVARLEHPHITPLYDYWRDTDGAYLVMRWLRGGSLREALDQGPLELPFTANLLAQIAGALSLAHRNGIIHRDIKPGNILLDEDGNAYLTDFGIAKDLNLPTGGTQTDVIIGSLDYISPEQARSQPVTARTDIYSLGVTLYEIITGKHPFEGLSSVERLYKHINDPLPEIEGLDPAIQDAVNRVIQKATQKNPEHRYADALAMAADFREAIGLNRTSTTMEELLTQREHQILALIIEGLSNKEIANRLTVALSTVKWYVTQIYDKLGVRSRVQAIVRARDLNLISREQALTNSAPIPTEDFFPENPYKGLRAFQSGDHQDYFGREKAIGKLLKRMSEASEFQRFLAVVGPSGSGKSSLVKAGLIPALWRGDIPGSDKWFIVEMLPGERPLDELEIALTKVAANQAANLHEHLLRDQYGLGRIASLILPNDQSELVIVIDQFEEVFTLVEDEAERVHFLDLLTAALTEKRSRIRIVITLRADFYDRPLHYPHFGEMVRSRLETIMPLSAEELESAIRNPAERVGVTFEQGLVASIISDVNYQPGALPLLQYALTELFEGRQGRLLTREVYETIGRATGALAKRAEEIYQGLDKSDQELTRQIFLRLVTLGEGTEDTRRRTHRSELLGVTEKSDVLEELLDTFTGYRLLSLDTDPGTRQPTVEIAHEALIREWDRLKLWLNDNRSEIKLQRQLAIMAEEWHTSGRDPSFLARGSRLDQFEQWMAQTELTLTADEKRYFEASVAQRALEVHKELEQQAREQSLEQRAQTSLRVLVAVFALATLISISLGVVAFVQRNLALKAQDETAQALAVSQRSGLAFAANSAMQSGSIDLALALAIESVGNQDDLLLPETRDVIEALTFRGGPLTSLNMPAGLCTTSENYAIWLLCDFDSGTWSIYDPLTDVIQATAPMPPDFAAWMAVFSPDGRYFVGTRSDWLAPPVQVEVWSTEDLTLVANFTIDVPIVSLRWSGDSSMIATIDILPENIENAMQGIEIGDRVTLRDMNTGEVIRFLRIDAPYYHFLNFSHDNSMGAVGGWSSFGDDKQYQLTVFDTETGVTLYQFERPALDQDARDPLGAGQIQFSPDDTIVWFGGYPGYAIELASGENYGHYHELSGPRTSPPIDFTELLSWDGSNTRIFNALTGELQTVDGNFFGLLRTSEKGIFGVNFFGRTDQYYLWDANGRDDASVELREPGYGFPLARYSPDGKYLAVIYSRGFGATSGSLSVIYDTDSLEVAFRLDSDLNLQYDLAWSPDGRYIATATDSAGIILWNGQTGQEIRRFVGEETIPFSQVEFTADSRYILSGRHSRTYLSEGVPYLLMWDVESGEIVKRIDLPHTYPENLGVQNVVIHPSRNVAFVTVNETAFTSGSMVNLQPDQYGSYQVNLDTGDIQAIENNGLTYAAEFTPDGSKLIVSAFTDNLIRVFDADMFALIQQMESPQGSISGISISPDAQTLVANGSLLALGPNVTVWDLGEGELLREYKVENSTAPLVSMDFDPDGEHFATTGFDGVIRIWNFDRQRALDWLRENRYVRDLTCQERQLYRVEPLCETANQQ